MSEYFLTKYDRYDKNDELKKLMLKVTDYTSINYQSVQNETRHVPAKRPSKDPYAFNLHSNEPKYKPREYMRQIRKIAKEMAKEERAKAAPTFKQVGLQYLPKERLKSSEFMLDKPPSSTKFPSLNAEQRRNFDIMSNPSAMLTKCPLSDNEDSCNKSVLLNNDLSSVNIDDMPTKQPERPQEMKHRAYVCRKNLTQPRRRDSNKPTTLNQKEFLEKEKTTRIPPPPAKKQSEEPVTASSLLSRQNISKRTKTLRGGYGYFYNFNQNAKNLNVKIDQFIKENIPEGTKEAQQELNLEKLDHKKQYQRYIKTKPMTVKKWDQYNQKWEAFIQNVDKGKADEVSEKDIPWPVDVTTFLYYCKDLLIRNKEVKSIDTEAKVWTKAKFFALKRYHPDKIDHNLGHLIVDCDREEISKRSNAICQIVTTLFEKIL
ncbi:unnamed protein product [Moneuplotes crassus]|uniref:Uncharacterized protein n=1 Tax=Euplotes crassus TaxID=5936 RepID=A0AAD1X883_EUPCR|nr:unnamed protein product [Moneuplotes crassus]